MGSELEGVGVATRRDSVVPAGADVAEEAGAGLSEEGEAVMLVVGVLPVAHPPRSKGARTKGARTIGTTIRMHSA
jgi:hypothetical protein